MSTIGKIYKIYSKSANKTYVGSTTQLLLQRFLQHKKNYKSYTKGKFPFVTSFHILEYDDCNIELIEEVYFDDKTELLKRERFHIENNSNCVNKVIPGRTKKEWGQDNKNRISEHKQKYCDQNRKRIKQYYQANKKSIIEQQKQWYQANREVILEKLKEKITCGCGSVITKHTIRRHEKSIKHQNYLKTIV